MHWMQRLRMIIQQFTANAIQVWYYCRPSYWAGTSDVHSPDAVNATDNLWSWVISSFLSLPRNAAPLNMNNCFSLAEIARSTFHNLSFFVKKGYTFAIIKNGVLKTWCLLATWQTMELIAGKKKLKKYVSKCISKKCEVTGSGFMLDVLGLENFLG